VAGDDGAGSVKHQRYRCSVPVTTYRPVGAAQRVQIAARRSRRAGGNRRQVVAEVLRRENLHGFWDIEFVERLETDPRQVASNLIGQILDAKRRE
jgi:hypothetical protein